MNKTEANIDGGAKTSDHLLPGVRDHGMSDTEGTHGNPGDPISSSRTGVCLPTEREE